MTIEQTIDIPADHRLRLDMLLPESVPAGRVKLKLSFKPFAKRAKARKPQEAPAGDEERTDGIPMANGCTYYPAPPGYTPHPPSPELAAILKEAEEKAERRRTDPVYRAEVAEHLRKCQEGGPIFGNMDGEEFQRQAREGWLD
jgi:hypothetical protein